MRDIRGLKISQPQPKTSGSSANTGQGCPVTRQAGSGWKPALRRTGVPPGVPPVRHSPAVRFRKKDVAATSRLSKLRAGWKPALRALGLTPGIGARSFRSRNGHLGMRSGAGSDGARFLVADVWSLRGGRRLLDLRNLAGKQELLNDQINYQTGQAKHQSEHVHRATSDKPY